MKIIQFTTTFHNSLQGCVSKENLFKIAQIDIPYPTNEQFAEVMGVHNKELIEGFAREENITMCLVQYVEKLTGNFVLDCRVIENTN